eukprot:jgi/Bigna1/128743/aug1.7_g3451
MQSLRNQVLQWSDKVKKKTRTEEEQMRSRKRVAIVKSELERVHRELQCEEDDQQKQASSIQPSSVQPPSILKNKTLMIPLPGAFPVLSKFNSEEPRMRRGGWGQSLEPPLLAQQFSTRNLLGSAFDNTSSRNTSSRHQPDSKNDPPFLTRFSSSSPPSPLPSSGGKNATWKADGRKQHSSWRYISFVAVAPFLVGGFSLIYYASIDSLFVFLGILR